MDVSCIAARSSVVTLTTPRCRSCSAAFRLQEDRRGEVEDDLWSRPGDELFCGAKKVGARAVMPRGGEPSVTDGEHFSPRFSQEIGDPCPDEA